ncbi:MAG: hypothetical protein IKX37_04790 [Bacteroidales bacterium]|nr:hypothetical protein [Bacteroidales bacterium]
MKKYFIVILAAIISAFAVSCSKEADSSGDENPQGEEQPVVVNPGDVPEGYVRLVFDAEAEETKTAISEGEGNTHIVSWVAGDKVKVSYAGGSAETLAEETGATTHFTVDVPAGTERLYFSYPFSADTALDGSILSVTIPAEQDGAFSHTGYLIATAASNVSALRFFNAGSLFKIVVDDATLTRAVITGNNGEALVGTVPFTFSETAVTPGAATETGTSLTVNFSGAGTYYASALPGLSLSDGATIRFFRGEEPAGGARWTGSQSVARAQIASWGNADKITCRYVRADAAAGGNGRSWETAWGRDEFKAFLTNSAGRTAEQLDLVDGITVKVAAGTYVMAESAENNTQLDWSAHENPLTVHFVGGYPAAGGDTANPATNETILSGDDKGCVLWVKQKSHLSFDGFTFSHGSTAAGGGAAVVSNHSGTASFTHCKFADNLNTYTSGALNLAGNGTFSVADCVFSSNTATNAGALNMDGTSTKVTVTRCVFNANDGGEGNGGALKVTNGTATLEDCTFTGNHSGNHGGALWIAGGEATVSGCTFKGNYSNWGGAVYTNKPGTAAPTVNFSSCTFGGNAEGDANYATTASGGAVACDAGIVHFNACTFTKNTATADRGGAIFITNAGTEVYIGDEAVSGSGGTFTANSANNGGVITIQNGAQIKIYNGEFSYNTATYHGGILFVNAGSPIVRLGGNKIHDNSTGRDGGAIAVKGTGGSEPNSPEIYVESGNTFTNNYAPNGGGAIKLRDEPAKVTTSGENGNETKACLYISGTNTFEGNHTATGYGGCLDLRTSGTVVISGAIFRSNHTDDDADTAKGGCINLCDSSLETGDFTITDCIFDGNYTNGKDHYALGGAINVGGSSSNNWAMKAKIARCLFKDNHARQAGAIWLQGPSAETWISDCAFTGNHITGTYGTTINITYGKSLCLNNCSFADDTFTENSNGQQSCWVNFKADGKFVMSNSTLIGTTRKATGLATSTNPNLLRFDGTRPGAKYLINNIIAPTGVCNALDARDNDITAKFNKHGSILNGGNYVASGTDSDGFLGTSACFGALKWLDTASPASWTNRYWSWDGTLSGGSNTEMAKLADVQTAITEADSDFAAWLISIGSFDKDCAGNTRGTKTWPGAYDGTNDM